MVNNLKTSPPVGDVDNAPECDPSVPKEITAAQWQYTGPVEVSKIVIGDVIYDVRAMPTEAVEFLVQHHPSYGSWFKKQ